MLAVSPGWLSTYVIHYLVLLEYLPEGIEIRMCVWNTSTCKTQVVWVMIPCFRKIAADSFEETQSSKSVEIV